MLKRYVALAHFLIFVLCLMRLCHLQKGLIFLESLQQRFGVLWYFSYHSIKGWLIAHLLQAFDHGASSQQHWPSDTCRPLLLIIVPVLHQKSGALVHLNKRDTYFFAKRLSLPSTDLGLTLSHERPFYVPKRLYLRFG